MKIVKGDLISMALSGEFDVIGHGCNCLSTQGAGIAKQMVATFGTDKFPMELRGRAFTKLGNIDYQIKSLFLGPDHTKELRVVNMYTQYRYGKNHSDGDIKPIDYDALALCFKKLNHLFSGKKIGLPWIGCGLAGGSKEIVKGLMEKHLTDVDLIVVEYNK